MHKVLFISYDGMTDPLGKSQVLPYLEGLAKAGYAFTILSCEKRKNYRSHHEEVKRIAADAGIKWVPLIYHKKPAVLSTVYDVLHLMRKARQLEKKHQYDLVHTRPGIPALVGLHLKKKRGVKFLNDIREFYADSRIEGNIWNGEKLVYREIYKFFRNKEMEAVQLNDGIVCLTNAAEKIIRKWPSCRPDIPFAVIPCSVDTRKFNPCAVDAALRERFMNQLGISEADRVVSYLGSLGSWYLMAEMLHFFKRISDKKPETKFLFISPAAAREIFEKAAAFGIDKDKVIVINAKRNEVPVLLSLSGYSVFFIRPCYSKQSSSPTKHGEIMSMGIPVITNRGVGDVASIVENSGSGILLDDFSEEAFEKAAASLSEEMIFDSTRIRQAAIDHYDLDKAVLQYKDIYDQICKNDGDAR